MWRQGDVLFAAVTSIPKTAVRLSHCVLAEGEMTGHRHAIEEQGVAELYSHEGERFLSILTEAAVVMHQEHGPITLSFGIYRVWQQREYFPREIRRVMD